jgi:hypothetical protein
MSISATAVSTIVEDLTTSGATSAIPSVLGSIGKLVGLSAAAGVVDTTKKTIDVAWATANPTLTPLYMAQGYSIVP